MHLLCLAALAQPACGLLGGSPAQEEGPPTPDRQIAPWRPAPLEVCIGESCGPSQAAAVRSADLREEDGRRLVVAEIAGSLHTGELEDGFRLRLEEDAWLVPAHDWQSAGLADPDWVQTPDGPVVLYGVADGSALGVARLRDELVEDSAAPLLTAQAAGAGQVTGPTGLFHDGRLWVAFAADDTEIRLAAGTSLDDLGAAVAVLGLEDLDGLYWTNLRRLSAPELVATTDGITGLFFAARGTTPADGVASTSIGFAAACGTARFEPFPANPVYDRLYSFILHADESRPSVLLGARPALMLYRDESSRGAVLALAVHDG